MWKRDQRMDQSKSNTAGKWWSKRSYFKCAMSCKAMIWLVYQTHRLLWCSSLSLLMIVILTKQPPVGSVSHWSMEAEYQINFVDIYWYLLSVCNLWLTETRSSPVGSWMFNLCLFSTCSTRLWWQRITLLSVQTPNQASAARCWGFRCSSCIRHFNTTHFTSNQTALFFCFLFFMAVYLPSTMVMGGQLKRRTSLSCVHFSIQARLSTRRQSMSVSLRLARRSVSGSRQHHPFILTNRWGQI